MLMQHYQYETEMGSWLSRTFEKVSGQKLSSVVNLGTLTSMIPGFGPIFGGAQQPMQPQQGALPMAMAPMGVSPYGYNPQDMVSAIVASLYGQRVTPSIAPMRPPPPQTAQASAGISPQTMMMVGGALILALVVLKK